MSQPAVHHHRRLPRLVLALLLGGAAAAAVYTYVGWVQEDARREALAQAPMAPLAPAPTAVASPTAEPRAWVVVAKTDLPLRAAVRADDFELRSVPLDAVATRALTSLQGVEGMELAVPLSTGEQLLSSKLREPGPTGASRLAEMIPVGKRAVSVAFTESQGSGALIVPGDVVDVIATFDKDVMGKDQALILLQNVPVLAVAQSTSAEEMVNAEKPTPTAAQLRSEVIGKTAPVADKKVAPVAVGAKASATPTNDGKTAATTPTAAPQAADGPGPTATPAGMPAAPKAKTVTLAVAPEAAERLALAEDVGRLRYALRRVGDSAAPEVAPVDLATIRSPVKPAQAEILAVEISPTNVKVGDTVNVKVTIKNTSDKPLKTQGPTPGYTYVQGQTFYSQQYASEEGKWRVGVGTGGLDSTEFPYRWGFGSDLPPGVSTTVTGQIKITHDFKAINFWAGAIEEPAHMVQNGAGVTMVTAMPENVAVVAVDVANVRSGPSVAAAVIDKLKYGQEIEITGQSADWFRVKLPDQRQGWVAAGWIVTAGR